MTLQDQIHHFRAHRDTPHRFDRQDIRDMLVVIDELHTRLEVARAALKNYQHIDDQMTQMLKGFAATEKDIHMGSIARRALKEMALTEEARGGE